MSTKRWQHEAHYDIGKGKLRIQCNCGTQSPVFRDDDSFPEYSESKEDQAALWWENHTGLKERKGVKEP